MISSERAMRIMVRRKYVQRHTSSSVAEDVARNVQILPYYKRLDSAKVKRFQGIVHTEAVFAGVLADLVEVSLNKLLLLYELDVGKGLGGEFDSLSWTISNGSSVCT